MYVVQNASGELFTVLVFAEGESSVIYVNGVVAVGSDDEQGLVRKVAD